MNRTLDDAAQKAREAYPYPYEREDFEGGDEQCLRQEYKRIDELRKAYEKGYKAALQNKQTGVFGL